jgi:hypothetical protein
MNDNEYQIFEFGDLENRIMLLKFQTELRVSCALKMWRCCYTSRNVSQLFPQIFALKYI